MNNIEHNKTKENIYKEIHSCFINAKQPLAKNELVVALEEKFKGAADKDMGRSVSRYLQDMIKLKGAPIIRTGGSKSTRYHYSTKNFKLNGEYHDVDNLLSLEYAIAVIKQIEHLDLGDELITFKNLLEKSKKNDYEIKNKHAIYLDQSNLELKKNILYSLFEAGSMQNVVTISYAPFIGDEKKVFEFHPSFLQNFNGRWFCLGYNKTENVIHNYALDRIKSIKTSKEPFDESKIILQTNYNKNLYGVTRSGEPQNIIIQIKKNRAPYFISKPFCKTIKKEQLENGHFQFSFKLIINPELKSALLSYGADLQVIEPESLKNDLLKSAKAMQIGF
jgi:predicted DNA-binding transcriptional regulator YafY